MNAGYEGVARVPVIPEPPHDPASLLIDHRQDWHKLALEDVEISPCTGSLTLKFAPHAAPSLTDASGSFGGLVLPAHVAIAPDESIYLLDRTRLVIRRFDPCECRFIDVPCSRDFHAAGGIAMCGNTIYVADSKRVWMFKFPGFEIRGYLRPPHSENPQWKPVAVACDAGGCVRVSDVQNGRVHRFTRNGRWLDAINGLEQPGAITIDPCNRVYVVDHLFGGDVVVRVFDEMGMALPNAASVNELRSCFPEPPFSVGLDGTLHLASYCISPCSPNDGYFDLDGNPVPAPAPIANPYVLSGTYASDALDSRTYACQWHRIVLRGELPASTRVRVETFCSDEQYDVDQLAGFASWSRVDILPARDEEDPDRDCLILSPPGRYLWLRLTFLGNGTATPELRAIEIEFPRLGSLRYLPPVFSGEPTSADFTGRFLALFDTPLREIERVVDTGARFYDPASTPSERVGSGPIDFLSWLASWIGVSLERGWSEAQRRRFVKQAGKLFATRGTPEGLRRQLLLLLAWDEPSPCGYCAEPRDTCGERPRNCAPCPAPPMWLTPPLILEHFKLRRWLWLGIARLGAQAVLWGRRIINRTALDQNAQVGYTQLITTPDPLRDPFHYYAHRFTVFVPACVGRTEGGRKALSNLLRRESPAHTAWDVNYVEPRFRIGVQSMIGFDAVIGSVPRGMRLGQSPLGAGTMIESKKRRDRGLRIGKSGRVGTGSRLN